jgi:hypothetical protein
LLPFLERNLANIVNTMQGLFWQEVDAFQRKLWQSSPYLARGFVRGAISQISLRCVKRQQGGEVGNDGELADAFLTWVERS